MRRLNYKNTNERCCIKIKSFKTAKKWRKINLNTMWRMCAKQWSFVVKNSRISHLQMVTIKLMVLVFLGWNLQQHTFIGLNFFTAFYGVCHAQGLDHCPDVIIILCPNISDLQIRGLKYNFPDYTVKH